MPQMKCNYRIGYFLRLTSVSWFALSLMKPSQYIYIYKYVIEIHIIAIYVYKYIINALRQSNLLQN